MSLNYEQNVERHTATKSTEGLLRRLAESVSQQSESRKLETAPYPKFDGSQICAQVDPEIFFPDPDFPTGVSPLTAKALCLGCDFRTQCLSYALTHDVIGVWGGTTGIERRRLRRRYNILPVSMFETTRVS